MKYLALLLFSPVLALAAPLADRVACMEALAKFETDLLKQAPTPVELTSIGKSFIWDGKKIFLKSALRANREIWSADLFRKNGDGRIDTRFPADELAQAEEFIIKLPFNDLLNVPPTHANARELDSYFQQCKNVADVSIHGKGTIADLAMDKIRALRENHAFADLFRDEPKHEANVEK